MRLGPDGATLRVRFTAVDPSKEDMMETPGSHGGKGDRLIVKAHHVGESPRTGTVLEVLGEPDHVHYRVRWDQDGHESIFTPSNDATFEHAADRP
jgi:Domain of unknown function (DUF1918)